ncbi:TonB-dependent receptor plug domain-containing protein [Frateuria aurantia]|uniref:Outer membrane cobalamin receptor protein n=1 Tax=Frateuria aurantia (strain ATCC 33424 / DSM 6220 / KCTC 2777 / LMG 1558 / NBRC 3245 / NCIMB 13370) TaxID=767434 RepID=H8KYY9_FRAAD|nr:TonB-dependent receptor [Frateuria aurantia]AFC87019.1 outer membrane cobalamin receptor protein [Frateuria aurantia DSM 6220]
MKMQNQRLTTAVRITLSLGAMAASSLVLAQQVPAGSEPAAAKAPAKPAKAQKNEAKSMQAVQVTGSLIRRVDTETASPVVSLDAGAIANTGKPTLGQVLQQLSSVSGNAANTSNNSNGGGGASPTLEGGDGAARISLRGLGTSRTLVLIDGQRMANADLNMIPENMIQRVDVLAEGASTVYGSDAIGGVVNFILKKDYKGAEISANGGVSGHNDGNRRGFSLTAGNSGDKGSIVFGLNYNKYDPVLASARGYSRQQLYLSDGVPTPQGSSTIPTGRIQVGAALAGRYGCSVNSSGVGLLTLASGDGSSLDDYRCRTSSDVYNYNAYNYIQTSQERLGSFLLGNYKITDKLSFFGDVFYTHTSSSGQDAPAPTGVGDGWTLAADNPSNPFGQTFSSGAVAGDANSGYGLNTRLTGLGSRLHTFSTDNLQLNTGFRGAYGDSSWTWDAMVDYGYSNRTQHNYNEVNIDKFQQAIDSGVNIFDQANPSVAAALRAGLDTPVYKLVQDMKQVQFDSTGELWDLPAGAIQLSAGALYRQQSMVYNVSRDAILNTATSTCSVLQEACGSPGRGSFNVKELYVESLIPLLSEIPGAYALNLDIGVRSSQYSTTGTTTNKKIALEWRPIPDLLARGTISQVFRAPNLDELYDGQTIAGPNLNDPCVGLSASQVAAHPKACAGVPAGWSGNPNIQVGAFYSGSKAVGGDLKPEHGKSIDLGLVYDPSWLPGMSASVDFWHIYLSNLLTAITAQTVANSCFSNESSPYCSYIHRYDASSKQAGNIYYINTPVVNLGNLDTSGIDYAMNYRIPHFNLGGFNPGNFTASLNATYTASYKNDATPGMAGSGTVNYAGTYTQQFGNIARWRSSLTLNWTRGNWSAQWQSRYINHATNLDADSVTGASAPLASILYNSIQLGYEVKPIHTRFDIGIDNLSNKIPPLVYQNSADYNVDTSTYDTLGRYFWARATMKFL